MNSDVERRMTQFARLIRLGKLAEATLAIRSALGIASPAAADAASPGRHDESGGDVIDVDARVVDADRPAADADANAAESFTSGHFRNQLGGRDFRLFEPARDGRPLPLVVMLHGCKQDPDDFARGTGMNGLARARGFLVLYPAQAPRSNGSRCWNWFERHHQARGQGEPGILAGMVRDVIARHGIDADRVYVAGLSAGGAMAAILGDAYPELFAAVGVHSGLPTGSAVDVQTAFSAMQGGPAPVRRADRAGAAPPTIVFHGDADPTVHAVNASRVIEAMGLPATSEERRESGTAGREFSRRQWMDADGAVRAEQWTIRGAGHAWSGGRAEGSFTDARGPDASAEMLRFFLAHPKR
ncbi:MAG: PHB depolymerase family esterase [Burkholderiaceae bacterium]